jgi:hypothetical protein
VTRSVVNGTVSSSTGSSFAVSDSYINVGAQAGTGIGDANFVATRVEITGGNRSVNCSENCTIQDSYVHGQFTDNTGVYHESGIRIGAGSIIRHNTVDCTAPRTLSSHSPTRCAPIGCDGATVEPARGDP